MCGCIHRQQSIKMNGLTSLSGGCTQCVLSDENKNNVNITLACLFLSILVSWKNVSTQLLLKNFEFWIIICQLHWGDVRKAQEKRQSSNFMLDQASHKVGGLQIDIGDLCLTRRWPTWSSSLLSRWKKITQKYVGIFNCKSMTILTLFSLDWSYWREIAA